MHRRRWHAKEREGRPLSLFPFSGAGPSNKHLTPQARPRSGHPTNARRLLRVLRPIPAAPVFAPCCAGEHRCCPTARTAGLSPDHQCLDHVPRPRRLSKEQSVSHEQEAQTCSLWGPHIPVITSCNYLSGHTFRSQPFQQYSVSLSDSELCFRTVACQSGRTARTRRSPGAVPESGAGLDSAII